MLLSLRIQLAEIKNPPVWRRLTVPAQFSFHKLHLSIQLAFGWENYHLYQFSIDGFNSDESISVPHEDDWHKVEDSKKVKLSRVFSTVGQKYVYIYDYGDHWTHNITVEKVEDIKASKADCIAGVGACPPEDCGGPGGYQDLKKILLKPKHSEYESIKGWLGLEEDEQWDPAAFDLEKTRAVISKVKSIER
ncbi:MAG: plasmid pRiA4b ORF-3 family protein [Chitinophagaceae bacterium]